MNDRVDWQIVQTAPPPYARCIVSGFGDGPFVDFGRRITAIDPNILIQVDVLKDAARFVGMLSKEEFDRVRAENEQLKRQLEEANAKVDGLERFKESVDTIVSADFVARKKPGRPQRQVA